MIKHGWLIRITFDGYSKRLSIKVGSFDAGTFEELLDYDTFLKEMKERYNKEEL